MFGLGGPVEKVMDASEAFLKTLLGPLVTEIGQGLAEGYRAKRAKRVLARAEEKLKTAGIQPQFVPLKYVVAIAQPSSFEDDADFQDKWASLLARAAAGEAAGSMTLTFAGILQQLDPRQAKMLDWMYKSFLSLRDPLESASMIDPRREYESNCFKVSEFVGDFFESHDACTLAVADLVRLGVCRSQLDEDEFLAALAGKVVIPARKPDGINCIALTQLGIAFMAACHFPGPQEEPEPIEIDMEEDDDQSATATDNAAIAHLVRQGRSSVERVTEALVSSSTFREFLRAMVHASDGAGYGKQAVQIFFHDQRMLDQLNAARKALDVSPFPETTTELLDSFPHEVV